MDDSYTYSLLSLQTPDDDPRWQQYVDLFRLTLLSEPSSPAQLEFFRKNRREDSARLGMVTASTPLGERVAGGCNAIVGRYNAGAEDAPILIINTIGVSPAHRRRGLLREMVTQQLRQAKADGVPFATLTATEGTIYGRFGFGPVTRVGEATIDLAKFKLRDTTEIAPGVVEWVQPSMLVGHYHRIVEAFHARQLGSVKPYARTFYGDTGQWDHDADGPAKKLHALVHISESGEIDGFASFTHSGWESPRRVKLLSLFGSTLAVEFALWQALASMDLVEEISWFTQPGDPLPLALVDERAVKVRDYEDWTWLRILDLPSAIGARSFERDGETIVRVTDALGLTEGVWRIAVSGGRGTTTPTDAPAALTLDIADFARIWESNESPVALAHVGRIQGEADAVREFASLFARAEPSRNLTGY